jgi:hypothetical protein
MNLSTIRLVLPAAAWLVVASATAAPVPDRAPQSQGPISDYLRIRGKLPATDPPVPTKLSLNGNTIEVEKVVFQYVAESRERAVQQDGKVIKVVETVTIPVARIEKRQVPAKECKFFEVNKEGKLEAVEAKKAAELLKQPKAVLTGESAEVDPRHLELVKPGTLYVALPAPKAEALPVPLPPPALPRPEDLRKP